MLIMTAKVPKRRLTLGVAAAALLCCCAIALNFGQALTREVSAPAVPSPKGVRSNQDRIDYLSAYGWQVSEEPVATQELFIPDEMDWKNTPASGSSATPMRCSTTPPASRVSRLTCSCAKTP